MNECAGCGTAVGAYATYCDACSGDEYGDADGSSDSDDYGDGFRETDDRGDGYGDTDGFGDASARFRGRSHHSADASYAAPSPVARAVGALLAAAALLGGFTTLQSLQYVPQVLAFYAPAETVGLLVTQSIRVVLLVAFAVMTKRLFDGTADTDRYGRLLQVLAVASVAAAVVVSTFPDAITPWVPAVVDPAYVVLDVVLYYTAPEVFVRDSGPLVLGIVGASATFVAGTQLRRT